MWIGASVTVLDVLGAERGAERDERERRGPTSSGAPMARLCIESQSREEVSMLDIDCEERELTRLVEGTSRVPVVSSQYN